MNRLTLTAAAFLCCLPAALATMSPRNDLPALGKDNLPTTPKDRPPDLDKNGAAAAPEEKQEKQNFVITDDTEVQLDGRDCKFADVPSTAAIVTLAVAADKKTILKIHFKTKK